MFSGHLIAQKELEDREAAFQQARLELESAEEQLRIVEQSGVSSRVRSLNVVAPAAGVVIRLGAEEGESVLAGTMTFGGGTELVTIADLSSLMIEATVNEVDIGKVALDQHVTITVDAYPNEEWSGRISFIAPAARIEADTRVRVFDVEVEVLDPDERLVAVVAPGEPFIAGSIEHNVGALSEETPERAPPQGAVTGRHGRCTNGAV